MNSVSLKRLRSRSLKAKSQPYKRINITLSFSNLIFLSIGKGSYFRVRCLRILILLATTKYSFFAHYIQFQIEEGHVLHLVANPALTDIDNSKSL